MKLKSTVGVCFFLIFTIWGCNKEGLTKETKIESKATTEKIKTWLNTQSGSVNSQRVLLDGKVIDIPERILWNQTNYFEEANTNITPVGIELVNEHLTKNRYLVTEVDENGKVNRGNYYEVLNSKKITNATESICITPDFLNLKNIPNGFTGAIIKYDNGNNIIFSKHYENGVLTDKTDRVSVKKSKTQTPIDNIAPLDEGCTSITIDWYWQTWENGVLIYEEYLYSSTEILCEGGGGGGTGTSPTPEQQANAILNYMEDNTTIMSQIVSITDESLGPNTRNQIYEWKCIKGPGYFIKSWEKGGQIKVGQGANARWNYTSFTHLNTGIEGTVTGGTITRNELWNNPNFGLLSAHMSLGIEIVNTTTVAGTPFSKTFLKTPTISVYANNSVFVNPEL